MNSTQTMKLTTLAIIAASLTACGGSGGSTPAFTGGPIAPVVDNPVTVTKKVTIAGNVMSDDVSNADITITIGEKSYTSNVSTDASGAFTVEVDEGEPTDLVTIEAVVSSTGLHLITVPGSFEELAAKADQGVIAKQDMSIVTTAGFALAKALASDASIDSAAEYQDLLAEASSADLTNIATALQIVTTASYAVAIPSEYADTLALANDVAENTSNFLADVAVVYPGVVENAKQKLFSNNGFTQKFEEENNAGVYVSYDNFTLYALYNSGKGVASFFDDGLPSLVSQWQINDDGDLVLDYTVAEDRRDQVKLLNSSHVTLQTLQQKTRVTQNSDVITPATFDRYHFSGRFFTDTVPGSYSLSSVDARSVNLLAGGGGAWSDRQGNFLSAVSWSVDGDGRLVVRSSNGAQSVVFTRLTGGQVDSPVLKTTVVAGGTAVELDVVQFVAQ